MVEFLTRENSKIKKIKRMSTEKKYPVMVFSFKKYLNKKINADIIDNFITDIIKASIKFSFTPDIRLFILALSSL